MSFCEKSHLHDKTARILLLSLLVKHLTLRTQSIALRHQTVDLLPPLQDTLDGLVQDDLGLVQLALYTHDAVGLRGVLVLDEVFLEGGHGPPGDRGVHAGVGAARVGGGELVDDLGEQLVGDERRVLGVADDDAAHGLRRAVGVEGVRLLLDVLPDARPRALRHRLGEHGHEFAVAVAREAGEGREVALAREFRGGLWVIADYLRGGVSWYGLV